jgi:hypothetical protein
MSITKIEKVDLYDYRSKDRPGETVGSFVEAAMICAERSVHKLVFHLDDGKRIVFDSIQFSNDKNTVEIVS